jgi:hypothetical protein
VTLRKAKTGTSKLLFLTLLNSSSQPDWRAKLLGQYHFQQVTKACRALCRTRCHYGLHNKCSAVPGLLLVSLGILRWAAVAAAVH